MESDRRERFRADGHAAVDWVAGYLERVRDLPVLARVAPGDVTSRLPAAPPERGESFADVLRDLDEVLLPGITHWNHPRFFAYFANTGSEPGILAELLCAALNVNGMLWRTSPAATELELVACSWLAQLIGLDAGAWHGHIEDAASTSTLVALATARELAPERRVVVASEHAHSSIERACRLLGLELRKVPCDIAYRLDVDRLDLEGACAAVATLGTTSSTSVDPIRAIGERCRAAGVWLHVDAAYGGSALVCPEHREHIDGIELADSLVVNPHKWLVTPMDCSVFLTQRPRDVVNAFSLVPEYLRTSDDGVVNLIDYGPALGRRFRALKLWAVLRCYGAEGLRAVIREHVRMASAFAAWVEAEPGFSVVAPHPFSVVCFRMDGDDAANEALMARVNERGETYISHTKLDGRVVLRLAIGNAATTDEDVRGAWDAIRAAARAGVS